MSNILIEKKLPNLQLDKLNLEALEIDRNAVNLET
jgi:hypothetical protein